MHKDEIQVGKVYTNGKKREIIRKVTKMYSHILYFETLKGYKGYDKFNVLISSFARWANSEVKEGKCGTP